MRNVLAAVAACLGLAACAGGGSSAPTTTLATTTTTTGTTTTTTTPTTNANLTSLVASQNFANVGASATATANVTTPTVGPVTSGTNASVDPFTISYNLATKGYTITGGGLTQTFLPSDISAANSTAAVTAYSKTSGATQDALGLFNPGSANSKLVLTYTSFGDWLHTPVSGSGSATAVMFVYGIPTTPSDVPKTGTASYQTAVAGFWSTGGDLRALNATGTLSADFGAGTTQVSLNIGGVSQFTGATSTLGAFSGSGALNASAATFAGNLASTSSSSAGYSGAYAGRFFGPAATEAGAAFSLSNAAGAAVTGVIVGHK